MQLMISQGLCAKLAVVALRSSHHLVVRAGVGSLVVHDSNGRVVGFVTKRDFLLCIHRNGRMPDGAREPIGWNVIAGTWKCFTPPQLWGLCTRL